MNPSRSLAYVWLALGVLSVGAAAILIRKAGSPALVVAFWRTFVGGVALLVVVAALRRPLPRGVHMTRSLGAGALLGAHFWLWIESLEHTTVAASVVLVCLQPVFVVILARLLLSEKTPRVAMIGIAVALAGTIPIALDAPDTGAGAHASNALFGDALALAGAVAIALYVIIGRRRSSEADAPAVDILSYSAVVNVVASLTLLAPLLILAPAFMPSNDVAWFWVIALGLGPQVIGHTALNAALARLPASIVSGAILGEPVIATALAWVVLDEKPGMLTIGGSAITLVGLALILRRT